MDVWIGTEQPTSIGKTVQKGFDFIIWSSFDSLKESLITLMYKLSNIDKYLGTCRMKEPPNHNDRTDHWETNLWDNNWISIPRSLRIHTSRTE